MKIASKEYTLALQAVKDALKRQNDYLVHGTVPQELKSKTSHSGF